jgi:hypothetical protein
MILEDICDVYSGYAIKQFNEDKIGVPVIKIGNILMDGTIELEDCQYTTEKVNQKYYSEYQDIYIALSGATTGKIGILKRQEKFIVNQRVGIVRKKDNNIPIEFIKYFLFHHTDRIFKEAAGCAQPNISPKQIGKYKVPIIDDSRMKYVVEILDSLTRIINKRKRQLNYLDELIKARFVEMFGEGLKDDGKFKLKPISKIGQVVSGATPKTSRHEYWNGDNVWITPAELSDESFVIYNSERKLSYEGVDSCAVNLLPVGTVILSSRAPIGKVAIAGVEMYCNQGFKNIIPRDEISSIYLYELLKMETEYLNSLGRGATFKEISKQIVENIRVKVPPIELQNEFATFVEQVNKSKLLAASQPQIHIYKTLTLL